MADCRPTAVLEEERKAGPQQVYDGIKNILFGGEDNVKVFELAGMMVQRDPILFDKEPACDLPVEEHRER